jgi:hypothetical protein
MRFCSVFLYKPRKSLVIPSQVKTVAGFWLESDPVDIVPAQDASALARALEERFLAPIKIVPTPDRSSHRPISKIPTVRAVKGKSYTDFVRNVLLWHIGQQDDQSFEIQDWSSPPGRNHFEPDDGKVQHLPAGTSLQDLAEKFLQTVARAEQEDLQT